MCTQKITFIQCTRRQYETADTGVYLDFVGGISVVSGVAMSEGKIQI